MEIKILKLKNKRANILEELYLLINIITTKYHNNAYCNGIVRL
jgi:hypothetical protein